MFDDLVAAAIKRLGGDIDIVQICSGDTYSPKAMATPAGLTPVPGSTVMPVDPDDNFPSRAIVGKTLLHLRDWSAIELPAHEQARHEQLGLNSTLYLPLLRGEYGRYGNPTQESAERKLALLEGGDAALLFASGMAAATSVLLTLLSPGD